MAVLERLRAETRSEHLAIEAALGLGNGDVTLPRYRHLLERFYGFYRPLEPDLRTLGCWAAQHIDLAGRAKVERLARDLAALGVDPATLAICEERPRPRTAAEGFGVLYVLEGATLGGQVVAHHLRRSLSLTAENGGSFFQGYAERTAAMWQEFRNALAALPLGPAEEDALVRAAVETFVCLRAWCSR